MRSLLQTMVNSLLSADADAVVGAEWGKPSPDRTAQRNGYRQRELDTRVGTIDVAIPKLRSGSYFPEWLLERRKRAESAMVTVVADCYLAGVSTRRMDKLVKTLGIHSLSKSQVSRMAAELDTHVTEFRNRPLDEAGPFTFVAADALTIKVREGGRVINAVVMVATGVNADGHREVLGCQVATSETRTAWNLFFADLVARGLSGVRLVTSALGRTDADGLLRPDREHARDDEALRHRRGLVGRDRGPHRHRRNHREGRSGQHRHQEHQTHRPRIPQPGELPDPYPADQRRENRSVNTRHSRVIHHEPRRAP